MSEASIDDTKDNMGRVKCKNLQGSFFDSILENSAAEKPAELMQNHF